MEASNFVLIIGDLTTSQSRNDIHYLWSGSLWINWDKHGGLSSLTLPVPITG